MTSVSNAFWRSAKPLGSAGLTSRAILHAPFVLCALGVFGAFPSVADDAVVGAPLPAHMGDFSLKLEPGFVLPLNTELSERFDTGGSFNTKALFSLTPWLDVGPSVSVTALPSTVKNEVAGTAWTLGGGVQLKRPHDAPDDDVVFGIAPWLDADALYVRSGVLDRPGFSVGAGALLPIGHDRVFWLGPFVRYLHVLHVDQGSQFTDDDAQMLTVGLTLEVAPPMRREPSPNPVAEAPQIVERDVIREVAVCADGDGDGIPDLVDRCPEVIGVSDAWGCPAYKKVVVKPDKLELKEKLYFEVNEATLNPASFQVLDEVVQALKDNRGFTVQVEGHTSSEGGESHNQDLSEQRAQAVLDYLVSHGIAKDRLISKGFASTVPVDTNTTEAGRENNRRVEFEVNFIIIQKGNKS